MKLHRPEHDRRQRGNVLIITIVLLAMVMLGALTEPLGQVANARRQTSEETLAQAREALIGVAATYRDTHDDTKTPQSFGYLPCPNLDNSGISELSCGSVQVAALGRLPWKTLDIARYRDTAGECLWYAVSGRAKGSHKTNQLNWDTPGQFYVQDSTGKLQHDASAHARPLAIVIAPGRPLAGQESRKTSRDDQCPDLGAPDEYLEGIDARWFSKTHTGDITITIGDDNTANDKAIWLTASDIFERIKQRKDFKADIETMMDDLAAYLETLAPDRLPPRSITQKGSALLIDNYLNITPDLAKQAVIHHWRDNLLYATAGSSTYTLNLDGRPQTCRALLFFAGARTSQQRRGSADEHEDWRMYLEGDNASTFPNPGNYSGTSSFRPESASADIARCIGR